MKRFFQVLLVLLALYGTFCFYRDINAGYTGTQKSVDFRMRPGDTVKVDSEMSVTAESYGGQWYSLRNGDEPIKPGEYAGGFTKTFTVSQDGITSLKGEADITLKASQPFSYHFTPGASTIGLNIFATFLILVVFVLVAIGGPELISLFVDLLS